MTYAAIMTHAQADAEADPRLACAVEMARRFDAVMIGVGAEMVPPLAFEGGFYSLESDWASALRDTIETRLKSAEAKFAAAASAGGRKALWRSGIQLPAAAVAGASRAADLIVAGGAPRKTHDPYRDASAAELALTSGRPVLATPPHGRPLSAKRIVLAWKDTREARRALSDAMPFFEQAERVVVAAVSPEIDIDQATIQTDDVAAALGRRGIAAEAKAIEHAHGDGLQLLNLAKEEGADLIVMGAYGHSRLGEWAFGGVTASLLAQDDVYLLLSH